MASPGQHGMRIFGTQRTAVAGLAFAIVLVLAVGATEAAQAQTYKVIHNFAGGLDGAEPAAGLTMDGAGNLYGTTFEGDALTGTVFKLTHKNSSWVLSPLFLFTEGGSGGAIPYAKVIFGPDGTLYGTTGYGGNPQNCIGGCGTVFNLKPKPNPPVTPLSPWLERAIYPFGGGSDGANPYGADLIFDQAGNIYGTTYNGGGGGCSGGCGTVYKLTPSNGTWTESLIYSFTQGGDGQHPWGGVIFDQAGNLYGAAAVGGSGNGGTAFELTPSNGSWTFNLLYSFTGPGGAFAPGPIANLAFDSAGNLYGTTHGDGPYYVGSVFKLTPAGGSWTYTSLHDFTNGNDGGAPRSSIIFDKNGNLYGTAASGGTGDPDNCYGSCGVVFEITP